MKRATAAILAATLLAAACGRDGEPAPEPAAEKTAGPRGIGVAWDRNAARMTPEELERARLDMGWQELLELEDGGPDGGPNPERWEQISAETVNGSAQHLPIHGDVGGPSVLRVQILLDRALFSPGIMDGRWGKNSAEAIYWFQRREGLRATARADSATFQALRRAAGNPDRLVVRHTLTADDVAGPFTPIPDDIYQQAELECSCYESLSEKLSERFHATPELLAQLNPGMDLDRLRAGQAIQVPAIRAADAGAGQVARLRVSGRGSYLHALDASGRVLYHFPTTLGSQYSPSPSGDFRVTSVTRDPDWHYQPSILEGVDDDEETAFIPAGPNVAVGTVWMALNKQHYGIHGTAEPQTIGYASSNGCIRLTNWDAEFLARHVRPGTPVEFRDIGAGAAPAAPQERAATPAAAPARPASPARTASPASGAAARADTARTPRDTVRTGRDSVLTGRPPAGGGAGRP
jgi:lipoprotein-anchoring transpeptidase ErfK/SrfK